jgi:hypothetical protein
MLVSCLLCSALQFQAYVPPKRRFVLISIRGVTPRKEEHFIRYQSYIDYSPMFFVSVAKELIYVPPVKIV